MKPELEVRTEDHPEAGGRALQVGEMCYVVRLPLDDGRELVINMGQKCVDTLAGMILDSMANAPSYNDGSTNFEG
jgi:hypothetical protein